MPDFSRIINTAYMRILARPADPGGIENYNRLMNSGFSEAQMRESLLRSQEYADKNPEALAASATATAGRSASRLRSAATKSKTKAGKKKKKPAKKAAKATRRR